MAALFLLLLVVLVAVAAYAIAGPVAGIRSPIPELIGVGVLIVGLYIVFADDDANALGGAGAFVLLGGVLANDTIAGIPINRFVTFVKPLLNALAGAVAVVLVAKLNVLGIDGIQHDELQNQIASLLSFGLVTGLLELKDLKWLKGHHIELENGGVVLTPDDPDDHDPDEGDREVEPRAPGGKLTPSEVPRG